MLSVFPSTVTSHLYDDGLPMYRISIYYYLHSCWIFLHTRGGKCDFISLTKTNCQASSLLAFLKYGRSKTKGELTKDYPKRSMPFLFVPVVFNSNLGILVIRHFNCLQCKKILSVNPSCAILADGKALSWLYN